MSWTVIAVEELCVIILSQYSTTNQPPDAALKYERFRCLDPLQLQWCTDTQLERHFLFTEE